MKTDRERKEILLRLRRIEGQIRGLQRMIEEEVPCPDILTQVAAATSAIKKVGTAMIQTYMDECLQERRKESEPGREDRMKEFRKAISRYIDWA